MPASKQIPLTAPRGLSEHDFSGKLPYWEAACFDNASYFSVVELKIGDRGVREYLTFDEPTMAMDYARDRLHASLYAVAPSGRFVHLDRDKWDEWVQRWREGRS